MLSFEEAIEKIMKDVTETAKEYFDRAMNGEFDEISPAEKVMTTGTVDLHMDLDSSGKSHKCASKYGFGVTVHCTAWIVEPNSTTNYSGKITSSDGGGKTFSGLKAGEKIHFKLNTSHWHKTKVCGSLKASPIPSSKKVLVRVHYTT